MTNSRNLRAFADHGMLLFLYMDTEIKIYYDLPISILLSSDCETAKIPIFIAGFHGELELPTVKWRKGSFDHDEPYLTSPPISETGYARLKQRSEGRNIWGSIGAYNPADHTYRAMFLGGMLCTLQMDASQITYSDYMYGKGHPISNEITALGRDIDEWFEDLCNWVAVVTKQDLRPNNPFENGRMIGAGLDIWTEEDNITSLIANTNMIVSNFDPNANDKALKLEQLRKIFELLGNHERPPDSHLILREARNTYVRGHKRRAAIEAGAAAENALRNFVNGRTDLDTHHPKPTLGNYIKGQYGLQIALAANLPHDTETGLLDVRNNAMHYNPEYDESLVERAIIIATQIVNQIEPLGF